MEDEWSLEFFVADSGRAPVTDFLDALDPRTRARFFWSMEQLRQRNVHARAPLVKPVGSGLWELREESNTNIYRVIYFFFTGRRIVLLHGFQKKTQQIPARELDTARKRQSEFVEQQRRLGS